MDFQIFPFEIQEKILFHYLIPNFFNLWKSKTPKPHYLNKKLREWRHSFSDTDIEPKNYKSFWSWIIENKLQYLLLNEIDLIYLLNVITNKLGFYVENEIHFVKFVYLE